MITGKKCNACGVEKPFDDYYKSKSGKYGYMGQCKKCMAERKDKESAVARATAWNRENKERRSEIQTKYSTSDRGRVIKCQNEQKRRSRKNDIEYTLPDNFFELALEYYGSKCMKCSETEELTYDHIIPVNWGTLCSSSFLNLQILCKPCNSSKRDRESIDYRPRELSILGEGIEEKFDIRSLLE